MTPLARVKDALAAGTAPDPADVAEVVRDAERYRWLRDRSEPPHNFYISVPIEFKDERYSHDQVDAAIDAAIGASASTTWRGICRNDSTEPD